MANIGPMELIVVLIIALVVIGPKKLPDVGRSVGRGMREFKTAVAGDQEDELPELMGAEAADPAPPIHPGGPPAA